MTAHRLTASSASLAHCCTWSFRGDLPALERPAGRAAQLGTMVHAMASNYVNGHAIEHLAPPSSPDLVPEAQAILEGPLRELLDSRRWSSENGLVYDAATDTAAFGPRRGEDGYDEVTVTQIRATTDLVHLDGDTLTCLDLKTGKAPSDAEQLYVQAVAASRVWKVKRVRIGYARALKTKLQMLNEETLDEDALDAQAGRLGRLLKQIPVAPPVIGNWCWKCSAFSICPAQQEAKMHELEQAGVFA